MFKVPTQSQNWERSDQPKTQTEELPAKVVSTRNLNPSAGRHRSQF
jgi:hypothetical protein